METRRNLICNKLYEFLNLGYQLGYFSKDNEDFVLKKIEGLKDIVFCDRIVGNVVAIDSNKGPVLMVNPNLFDIDEKDMDLDLFREFAHYVNGISDSKKGNKKSLAEEKFEVNLSDALNSLGNINVVSVRPGLKLLDEAVSNEIAESMVAYKNRESRKDMKKVTPSYAQILFHTNFKENGISQEISSNFAKMIYGEVANKDALFILAKNSFTKDYLRSLLASCENNKEANRIVNALHLMGMVYSAEQVALRGGNISFQETIAITTSFNKANSLMQEKLKTAQEKTSTSGNKIICKK